MAESYAQVQGTEHTKEPSFGYAWTPNGGQVQCQEKESPSRPKSHGSWGKVVSYMSIDDKENCPEKAYCPKFYVFVLQ